MSEIQVYSWCLQYLVKCLLVDDGDTDDRDDTDMLRILLLEDEDKDGNGEEMRTLLDSKRKVYIHSFKTKFYGHQLPVTVEEEYIDEDSSHRHSSVVVTLTKKL